jgi:stalled ribosome rescue protein Dom34
MSKNNKKQFGVWMDSHSAIIVGKENVDSGKFVILGHEKVDDQFVHTSESGVDNAERDLLHQLFKDITAHMQNVDELHVTGTGIAQEQFINYLNETAQYKNVESKESTSNKMSDDSLIEYVAAQFS